ncbi:hypothetical protein CPTAKMNP4_233 [Salmonella phage vB_SenM-AKM_NP4]|uniref:Uncharacterized protein n=1 Tax=Salmonella phage S16 TaxID=1087482 RepID=M1GU93_BPS16|nr:hypothetical protein I133_gp036 [Salmonella phage vB_SenM-S16]AGE48210.1 hypothetical protein [Salmonella phage vB_SenM-S16]WDR21895.1 hypothetical protein PJM34_0227 [Salmonella phage vB_SenM_UTK0003]WLI71855.1 hypothetical protein CPTAKMNP4_233 [Salmonella phage vB_SenM-AKM_NP4]
MQITMSKEEFDKAISDAVKHGKLHALCELNDHVTAEYNAMNSNFLWREANIEMTRQFLNIIRERIRNLR